MLYVSAFGLETNSIGVNLRWNTKEKQQEILKYIYNSPAINFGNHLDHVINNSIGVSSCQGVSIKAEKIVYPLNSTEIKFTITNHSGKESRYGECYFMTAQRDDSNWFRLPSEDVFHDVAYGIEDGESGTLTTILFPTVLLHKSGTYRFFQEETLNGNNLLLMATFELK